MIEYCNGLMFNKTCSHVLMLKKTSGWQKDKYNTVGGKVKSDESSVQAVVREFKEETNIDTLETDWKYFLYLFSITEPSWGVYFFVNIQDTFYLDDKIDKSFNAPEPIKIHKVSDLLFGGIPMIPNLRWIIPLALDKNLTPICIEEK